MVVGGGLVTVVSGSCDPMDYSLPGSSVHGIFLARILEWVNILIQFFCISMNISLESLSRCGTMSEAYLTDKLSSRNVSICTYQQYRKVSVSPIFLPV